MKKTIIILVLLLLAIVAYVKKTSTPPISDRITTLAELEAASTQLDQVDVDGLGNEMNQLETDASTF